MEIKKATPEEICEAIGMEAWIGTVDGKVVGISGITRDKHGRCWGFFDVMSKVHALSAIRGMKRVLAECKQDVYVLWDHEQPTAIKLLPMLGFAPINETRAGKRVWKCRA